MTNIHSTALIDPKAEIAKNVQIGPGCIVGPDVVLGEGCRLIAQCYITGHTTLGKRNTVFPGACIGTPPQDTSYDETSVSYVKIGDDNIFREGATVHLGTKPGSETVIGNNCFFMVNTHVGHNCVIGNNVVMVNAAATAGYVTVGDGAFFSAHTAVHQFCRVGRFGMLSGGGTAISKDLPPFMIVVSGRNGLVRSVNLVALRRNGFSRTAIRAIKDVYQIFYKSELNTKNALQKIRDNIELIPEVIEFIDFVESSERGVLSQGGIISERRS